MMRLVMHVTEVPPAEVDDFPVGAEVTTLCGKTRRRRPTGSTRPFACSKCLTRLLANNRDRSLQVRRIVERHELGGKIIEAALQGLKDISATCETAYTRVDELLAAAEQADYDERGRV